VAAYLALRFVGRLPAPCAESSQHVGGGDAKETENLGGRRKKYAPKLNASYKGGGQLKGLEWRRGRTIHCDTNGPFALATRVFMNEFEKVCAQYGLSLRGRTRQCPRSLGRRTLVLNRRKG
jgi:hypothetical protein